MVIEVSSEQSRNQFYSYVYIILLPPLLPLCCVLLLLLFLFLLRRRRVRFHNRVPGPDRLKSILVYSAARRTSMHSYIPAPGCCAVRCYAAVAPAAAPCCWCSLSCVGWQNLLLWFTASDSSVFFVFIQTRLTFYVSLGGTVAFTASTSYLKYMHTIHPRYYGKARSQGGR